jgi:DNA-binding beta-propeller fold protein YncE
MRGGGHGPNLAAVRRYSGARLLNPVTHTLYVADLKGSVDVIDVAACNAVMTNGCTRPVRKISDGQGPAELDIDLATDTVYAVNNGDSDNGDTVSMINGATCTGRTAAAAAAPRPPPGRRRRLLGRSGPGPPQCLRRQRQRRHGLGHQ